MSWRHVILTSLLVACLSDSSESRASVAAHAAGPSAPNAARSSPKRIRVRLTDKAPKITVRGYDLKIYHTGKKTAPKRWLAATGDKSTEWELRCGGGKIWGASLTSGKSVNLIEPVTIETPAGFLHYEGKPFREELRIYSKGDKCEVVNVVDIEDYLDGVVNAEFNSKWSPEAIAAQVVAARTYALYQIGLARKKNYDVDSTEKDQMYEGSIREDAMASKVVDRTRGLVLTAKEGTGKPLKAFYHSTCGGITNLPQYVWGAKYPGFKRAVKCPYCVSSPRYEWQVDMPGLELGVILQEKLKMQGQKLSGLRVKERDTYGRVLSVETEWETGGRALASGLTKKLVKIEANKFREWVGNKRMFSTAFHIRQEAGTWKFEGKGYGHGVGLCQYGAKAMGEKGFDMTSILSHYYPDATLRKLW